ncbi:MAG: hypothetical protein IT372_15845 [Polyangiaceae bacterium]|nr:hypothetical protein [Polyangiaceae bacterium]
MRYRPRSPGRARARGAKGAPRRAAVEAPPPSCEAPPPEVLAAQRRRIEEAMAEARESFSTRIEAARALMDELAAEAARAVESFQRELEENEELVAAATRERSS